MRKILQLDEGEKIELLYSKTDEFKSNAQTVWVGLSSKRLFKLEGIDYDSILLKDIKFDPPNSAHIAHRKKGLLNWDKIEATLNDGSKHEFGIYAENAASKFFSSLQFKLSDLHSSKDESYIAPYHERWENKSDDNAAADEKTGEGEEEGEEESKHVHPMVALLKKPSSSCYSERVGHVSLSGTDASIPFPFLGIAKTLKNKLSQRPYFSVILAEPYVSSTRTLSLLLLAVLHHMDQEHRAVFFYNYLQDEQAAVFHDGAGLQKQWESFLNHYENEDPILHIFIINDPGTINCFVKGMQMHNNQKKGAAIRCLFVMTGRNNFNALKLESMQKLDLASMLLRNEHAAVARSLDNPSAEGYYILRNYTEPKMRYKRIFHQILGESSKSSGRVCPAWDLTHICSGEKKIGRSVCLVRPNSMFSAWIQTINQFIALCKSSIRDTFDLLPVTHAFISTLPVGFLQSAEGNPTSANQSKPQTAQEHIQTVCVVVYDLSLFIPFAPFSMDKRQEKELMFDDRRVEKMILDARTILGAVNVLHEFICYDWRLSNLFVLGLSKENKEEPDKPLEHHVMMPVPVDLRSLVRLHVPSNGGEAQDTQFTGCLFRKGVLDHERVTDPKHIAYYPPDVVTSAFDLKNKYIQPCTPRFQHWIWMIAIAFVELIYGCDVHELLGTLPTGPLPINL
jgi:hypothetical protein